MDIPQQFPPLPQLPYSLALLLSNLILRAQSIKPSRRSKFSWLSWRRRSGAGAGASANARRSAGAAKQAGASASAGMGVSVGAVNELRGWDLVLCGPKTKKSARWLIVMVYFGSSYWT